MIHLNPFETLQAVTPQVASMAQGHATLKGLGETCMPEHLAAQLHGPKSRPTRFSSAAGPVLNLKLQAAVDASKRRVEVRKDCLCCLQVKGDTAQTVQCTEKGAWHDQGLPPASRSKIIEQTMPCSWGDWDISPYQ